MTNSTDPVGQTAKHGRRRSSQAAARSRRKLPWWKLLLFGATASTLIIALAETALRLAGVGTPGPFFKPILGYLSTVERTELLRVDPGSMWPYFGRRLEGVGRLLIGSTVPETLLMPKPPEVLRVFFVGESTVQGFPHPPNLAAATFLEKFLQARSPDKKVEVINCGMTAVASYPLRKIVREVARLDADLIIVYAGHNEFFGAFGVASAQGAGVRPWLMGASLWLRTTGIAQVMTAAMDWALSRGGAGSDSPPDDAGLMSRMAAVELIPPGSPLRRFAEESLSANMDFMMNEAKVAGVKMLVCSLAANERDLEPVRSMEPPPDTALEWWDIHTAAMDAFSSGPKAAQEGLIKALELWPDHAESHFYLARTLELEGRTTEALEHYRLARDLDAMPWRAPTSTNELLKNRAAEAGVPFVDVDAAFHNAAGGAPGWKLFADHLHPTLEGQALLARTLTEAIEEHDLLPLKPADKDDWRLVANVLGDNRLSRFYTANLMMGLFRRPPLDRDEPGQRYWTRETDRLFQECEDFEKKAIARMEELIRARKPVPNLSYLGGEEAMKAGRYAEAAEYFGAAYNAAPKFSEMKTVTAARLLAAAAKAGKYGEGVRRTAQRSLSEATYVANMEVANPAMLAQSGVVLAVLAGNKKAVEEWMDLVPADQAASLEQEIAGLRDAMTSSAAVSTSTITLENGNPAPQNAR